MNKLICVTYNRQNTLTFMIQH